MVDHTTISIKVTPRQAGSMYRKIMRLEEQNKILRAAIEKTIADNLHLADGDVCTLIGLKNALKEIGK